MTAGRIAFIGTSTGASTIMRLFPVWAEHLGLEGATIAGVDLPLGAPAAAYRRVVRAIRADPAAAGALVTSHKLDLFRACRDLFDWVDPHAARLAECSCLSKRDGAFRAHAKDALTARLALGDVAPPGHFAATGGHVLCLGAGGAGLAITLALLEREPADRPARIVTTDRAPERLAHLRELHGGRAETELAYRPAEGAAAALRSLPPGSLVINATGLGKDAPGSPLPDDAAFPERGVAWELNYRGDLQFLQQARAQAAARSLSVHDGWRYFIFGWTAVIEEVYALALDDAALARLTELAEGLRP